MSDLIRREDAIHILACEMYAEAQSEGYDAESVEDYIPEATAWMSDAPSAEITVHDARLVKRVLIGDKKNWGGLYYPDAEPKTEMVLCALADRACPFQGKEYAWCLTCPHISEEDRELVKKAVAEPKTGEWIPVTKVYKPKADEFPNMYIEWEDATGADEIDAVKCSECGEVFDFADARNWCTQCGARMIAKDTNVPNKKGSDDE